MLRVGALRLRPNTLLRSPQQSSRLFQSSATSSSSRHAARGVVALALGGGVALGLTVAATHEEPIADDQLHWAEYPWAHAGPFDAFDAAAIRRGYQVYRQVCSTCHSMNRIAWRNLVGVCYTEDEVKEMAAEVEYTDGPNDEGESFERPGKLSDYFQAPYPNEQAGRFANGGAYPPDLSLIKKARPGGENYIFALLTGYKDLPAHADEPRDGLYYNPYFPGGYIGMPAPLMDGAVDYDDGTEASASQMAKDVCTFLAWTSEPELNERKRQGLRVVCALGAMMIGAMYFKRLRWSPIKGRKITFH